MAINKETIIISLGGSLVAPGEIDFGFLKNFKHCLEKYINKTRFFIIVGGGKICRIYQKALAEFGANNTNRDWMGIKISRLNAEVIKHLFGNLADSKIIEDPTKKITNKKNIVVAGGWKPGWSTDYVSVQIAKTYNIKTIINLTNIDYVCNKDPKQFPDAKAIKEISWKDFQKIVGNKWTPGLSMPFDPRASKMAEKLKLKVVMINGKNLDRLEDFLNNKPFIGTIIK
ncbi:MAG: UMP kinase [Patescibacteria group bacterium]